VNLRDKVGFSPSEGLFKIYIIDEVHMLSTSAFNALLKTLGGAAAPRAFRTGHHRAPQDSGDCIESLSTFRFPPHPRAEIAAHLRHIADVEGFGVEDEALAAIGRSAQGCMRDAVSLLDQMRSFGTETVTLIQVQQVLGAVSAESVASLVDARLPPRM
jgi:DNA polymerase-3 subunit gamma/tau